MDDQLRQQPAILDYLDDSIEQALTVHLVAAGSCHATMTTWQRQRGAWRPVVTTAAVAGRGGLVSPDGKHEGDGATPTGVYPLSLVFGYGPEAPTAMPYRRITADDCWVDDPASPQYNTWVRGRPQAASWETLLRPDGLYKWGIVVDYNTAPIIPGKGSAIFIHLWRGPGEPTSGCVALAEDDLLRIIAWLSPAGNPVIVLGH
ncbi:MAG TPA: L,D-transpeptidase family protein [Negativicutes bacterium]|nr:L,D-transpeptidase family protein [Negativicutes bacterium]